MDNLAEVEAWLAERPNSDRLVDPRTIWAAFKRDTIYGQKWEDDPGEDPEDEYWGSDDNELVDCWNCGRSTLAVPRTDKGGKTYHLCPKCHEANPNYCVEEEDRKAHFCLRYQSTAAQDADILGNCQHRSVTRRRRAGGRARHSGIAGRRDLGNYPTGSR
jgi:hypothetical protein